MKLSDRSNCCICGCKNLETVAKLPSFPLTGIFVGPDNSKSYPLIDQVLLLCPECGHGQLKNGVDPKFLYQDTYAHRTSPSPISKGGNDFLFEVLSNLKKKAPHKSVVEFGCNDLYLLQRLKPLAQSLYGIDPMWIGCEPPTDDKIKVFGAYAEAVPWDQLATPPDLVISAHTFEHIESPREVLASIVERASSDAVFVIETPSFDTLLHTGRFDQVFHQHVNYFSLSSTLRLIEELSCNYLFHLYNHQYWNGTQIIAFTKSKNGAALPKYQKPSVASVRAGFDQFLNLMNVFKNRLEQFNSYDIPVYGFGAAQMVPVLAYHLGTDLSELECIYDDNLEKHTMGYPNLKVKINAPADFEKLRAGVAVVTALDSSRKIIPRLSQEKVQLIYHPLGIL